MVRPAQNLNPLNRGNIMGKFKLTEARRERYALLCNIVTVIAITVAFPIQFGMAACIPWMLLWIPAAFFIAAVSDNFLPIGHDQILDRYLAIFFWYGTITHLLWLTVWHIDEIAVRTKELLKEILMID